MFKTTKNLAFLISGAALLVTSLIDLVLMAVYITFELDYSAWLSLFCALSGFVLFQGITSAIIWVRRLVPTLLVCAAGDLLLTPLETPVQLLMTNLRLHPLLTLVPFCSSLLLIAALSLTRQLLSSSLAREELKVTDGKGWRLGAIALGLLLLAAQGGYHYWLQHNPASEAAMATARNQYGEQFHYHVSALPIEGITPFTIVTIYDEKSINQLHLGSF